MNNKKIIITILSFIILFAISCKSNEDPATAEFKPTDLIGTWFGGGNSFTIDSSRNLNFDYQGVNYRGTILFPDEPTQYLSASAYSDTNYFNTSKYNIGYTIKVAQFSFNSSSSCNVYIGEIKLKEEYEVLKRSIKKWYKNYE